MNRVSVRAPATTANLGPGFDCLGLALDLWNEATFELTGKDVHVEVHGLGKGHLPESEDNLVARMALRLFDVAGQAPPVGLFIHCENRIPPGSGLGSSAAAALCGLVGANALLDRPLSDEVLLELAAECEGHPDNAAAALFGGLVISANLEPGIALSRVEPPAMQIALAVPHFELPTRVARQAVPGQIGLRDAVFNIGRTALVVEALRSGDLELLGKVMHDRLHQPYRLRLIPGAEDAVQAARQAGAAAVALSGAGPSLVAFARQDHDRIAQAMCSAFHASGLDAQGVVLGLSLRGAQAVESDITA